MEKQRRQKVNRRLVLLKNLVMKNRSRYLQDSPDSTNRTQQLLVEMFNNPLRNMRKPADGCSQVLDKPTKKGSNDWEQVEHCNDNGSRPRLRRAEGIQNLKQFFETQMTEFEERFPTNIHQQLYKPSLPPRSRASPFTTTEDRPGMCENDNLPREQDDRLLESGVSPLARIPYVSGECTRKTLYVSPIIRSGDRKRGEKRSQRSRSKSKGPMYTSTPKKIMAMPKFSKKTTSKIDLLSDSPIVVKKKSQESDAKLSPKTSTPMKCDEFHQIQYNLLAKLSTPVLSPNRNGSLKRNKGQGQRMSLRMKTVRSRLFSRSRSFSDNSSIQSYGFV